MVNIKEIQPNKPERFACDVVHENVLCKLEWTRTKANDDVVLKLSFSKTVNDINYFSVVKYTHNQYNENIIKAIQKEFDFDVSTKEKNCNVLFSKRVYEKFEFTELVSLERV